MVTEPEHPSNINQQISQPTDRPLDRPKKNDQPPKLAYEQTEAQKIKQPRTPDKVNKASQNSNNNKPANNLA